MSHTGPSPAALEHAVTAPDSGSDPHATFGDAGPTDPPAPWEQRAIRWFAPAVIAYFAANQVIRVLISDSLKTDEAEQILFLGRIGWEAWGFGSQPALFTWIFAALHGLGLPALVALSLIKVVLLSAIVLAGAAAVRIMTGDRRLALYAGVATLFVPQYLWESQRDLIHSPFATAATAFFLLGLAWLLQGPSALRFLLVGVAFGVGVMAKYNFLIPGIALLAALLWEPRGRAVLVQPRGLLAVVGAAPLLGGLLIWTATNFATASSRLGGSDPLSLAGALDGVLGTASAAGQFVGPLGLLILGALLVPAARRALIGPGPHAALTLLRRATLLALVIAVVGAALFGLTGLKDRWMQPLLYPGVLLVGVAIGVGCSARWRRGVLAIAAVLALVAAGILVARPLYGPAAGAPVSMNWPYPALVAEMPPRARSADLVIADTTELAGNILHVTGIRRAMTPKFPLVPQAGEVAVIVWQADDDGRMPAPLADLVSNLGVAPPRIAAAQTTVAAPWLYGGRGDGQATLTVAVVDLPAP